MRGGDTLGDRGRLLRRRRPARRRGAPARARRARSARGRARRAVRGAAHAPDHLADRDRLAGLGEDLGHGARGGRRHLGVDLVGGDLDDRLVGRDRVADRLGPLEHDALGDRLAHRRHDDVDVLRLGRSARLRLGLGRRGRRGAVRGSDLGEHGADVDRLALGGVHLDDGSVDRRRTSASTLSVEISTRVSSAETESPSALRHSSTVPSLTESPIAGMTTSTVVVFIAIRTGSDLIA